MSSRHIRVTKIKHASPPSAGWMLSLGLKTAVTHEHSSLTKTCTLCKSQRGCVYSRHTYCSAKFLCECVCACACMFCFAPRHTAAFSGFVWLHLLYPSPHSQVTFLITLHTILQPINHYQSLPFGAPQFPPNQLPLQRWRPLGKDLIKSINLGSYYLQIGFKTSRTLMPSNVHHNSPHAYKSIDLDDRCGSFSGVVSLFSSNSLAWC